MVQFYLFTKVKTRGPKHFKPLRAPALRMILSLLLVVPSCSRYGHAAGVDGEAEQGRADLLRHVHRILFGVDRVWIRPFCRHQNGRAVHRAGDDAGRPISLGAWGLSWLPRSFFIRLLDEYHRFFFLGEPDHIPSLLPNPH